MSSDSIPFSNRAPLSASAQTVRIENGDSPSVDRDLSGCDQLVQNAREVLRSEAQARRDDAFFGGQRDRTRPLAVRSGDLQQIVRHALAPGAQRKRLDVGDQSAHLAA